MNQTISDDLLIARLRQRGLRLTEQRLAVYRALANTDRHPTAQSLYEQLRRELPSLSRATVYNNLETLVQHGLVEALGDVGSGAVHYDADLTPHANLACTRCGRIEDFYDAALLGLDEAISGRSGYQIRGARLVYYGLCPECQALAAGEK